MTLGLNFTCNQLNNIYVQKPLTVEVSPAQAGENWEAGAGGGCALCCSPRCSATMPAFY